MIIKSKLFIGAMLALMSVAAVVIIAVNTGRSGDDLQEQLDLGNKYVAELDYENAIIAYEKALEIDPYCTEAYIGLSDVYMALGQEDRAIEIMEQARNMLEDNVEVYVYLAQLYASQNQMELVISTLENGIQATNSDRLKDMLKEYQLAEGQVDPDEQALVAKAEEDKENASEESEIPETSSDVQRQEEDKKPSITIGLQQDQARQSMEPVLIIDQDSEEVVTVPLITPPVPVVTDNDELDRDMHRNEWNQDNSSESDRGNQNVSSDDSSGNDEGNQNSGSDNPSGSIGGDQGSDADSDSSTEEPDIPQMGIVGNVYGIDGEGIDGVTIRIYSEQDEAPITAGTDGIGKYIQGLPEGSYRVVLSKEGYVDLNTSISVIANVLTSNSYIMLTMEESQQSASLKGVVISAVDSQSIEGATVALLNGFDKTSDGNSGIIADSNHAVTQGNGSFSIDEDVSAGYYTIETSKDGYSTYHRNETIKPGENEITINMSPEIVVQGIYRIVLTWGESPRDLDSHLICTGDDYYHVYFGNKQSGNNMAELDRDDTSSYGPETITVQIESGSSYIYAVHNYTNGYASVGQNEAWNLANSGANVSVYDETGIIFDGNVPVNEQGITWEVFRIENGQLIVTNKVSFEHPRDLANSDILVAADDGNEDNSLALSVSADKGIIEAAQDTDLAETEEISETNVETVEDEQTEGLEEVTAPAESAESTESMETSESNAADLEEEETGSETNVETVEVEETGETAECESTAGAESTEASEDTTEESTAVAEDTEESESTTEESTAESGNTEENALLPEDNEVFSRPEESDEASKPDDAMEQEEAESAADLEQVAENIEGVEETSES